MRILATRLVGLVGAGRGTLLLESGSLVGDCIGGRVGVSATVDASSDRSEWGVGDGGGDVVGVGCVGVGKSELVTQTVCTVMSEAGVGGIAGAMGRTARLTGGRSGEKC